MTTLFIKNIDLSKVRKSHLATANIVLNSFDEEYIQDCNLSDSVVNSFSDLCKVLVEIVKVEKQPCVTQSVIQDWLQGLPSSCPIPFYDFEIYQWGYANGMLKENDSDTKHCNFIDKYWNTCAFVILSYSQR